MAADSSQQRLERVATPMLQVVESALRDAFVIMMSLVDEEDAVLLYRCTRLAEASPLLLEACDRRRTSMEEALSEKCSRLWTAVRPKLVGAIDEATAPPRPVVKERSEADVRLEQARVAAAVREQQFLLAKDSAVREALRIRAEEDESSAARLQESAGVHDVPDHRSLRGEAVLGLEVSRVQVEQVEPAGPRLKHPPDGGVQRHRRRLVPKVARMQYRPPVAGLEEEQDGTRAVI